MKNLFFLKKGPLGGSGGTVYAYRTPLVGCTVKTNTTDIQTVDSDYSKTIHQEMEEDHKTQEARDQGVEKHSCQIELRGPEHIVRPDCQVITIDLIFLFLSVMSFSCIVREYQH
jgi:hypothetical protein